MAEQLHPLLTTKLDGPADIVGLIQKNLAPLMPHARIFHGKFPDDIGGRIRRAIISDDDFRQG